MEELAISTMKRWIAGTIALLLGFGLFAASGTAAESAKEIRIYLDQVRIKSEDAAPYIVPEVNLTMVPVRVISEGLGAAVDWQAAAKIVTVTKDGVRIVMKIGQKTATVGGKQVALDAPAALKNSRTMVPLRFVSESLGLRVDWKPDTKEIYLSKPVLEETQMRGAWISTVFNLDWPSAKSYGSPDKQKQEYADMLDSLKAMGINTVFVQVRPAGDALYPSKLVPWTKYLTGTQGKDPGYNPLADLIEETHRRGMEFHAWFNPFRADTDDKTDDLAANHAAVQHPDWVVKDGGKLIFNPGIPAVRQHVIDAVMEVVNNYAIDGVHLDDYFYPDDSFADDAAFRAYNPKKIKNKGDWRRDNVNDFVRRLGEEIHAAKPELTYGISPFGVWRNQADDPTGSATKASVSAYDDMSADARAWIRGGWIDYIMPQIYWSRGFAAADYDTLVKWWAREVDGTRVKLYIGHASYKLGTKEAGWQTSDEIISQLRFNEAFPQVAGDVFFRAAHLLGNPLGLVPKLRSYYGVGEP